MPASRPISLIRTFVRHPNAANLLMVLLVLVGLFSASLLNRQLMPTMGLDAVSVNFIWPGASSEDVDTNILEVVEPELLYIDGIKEVNGDASEGGGGFWIVFEEGTNMSRAFSDVENGIRRVEDQLPEDMERPLVSQFEMMESVSRIALSGPFSESALKTIAKDMRDELLARGIDKVVLIGGRDPEVRVNVAPSVLRRLDMKLGDIAEAIRDSSIDVPSGTMEGSFERKIRSLGLAKTVDSIGQIEIRSLETGEKVYLKDISQIEDGFDESQPVGFFRGDRAISLQIQRSRSTDAIDAAQLVEDYLVEKRAELPPTLKVFHYQVQAAHVNDRIQLMVKNGGGGLLLVLIILYIFLSGRLAFWVAAGIPIAMLTTFAFMLATDQSFNMVSLMALIMTLGIIVDDAIVVGEHAATRKETGLPALDAAESGAMRMFAPVMASSLTTVVAFLPVLMITDMMGQIIKTLPMVVIAVIIASLVECFLILPGHLRSALQHTKVKTSGYRARFNRRFNEFRDTTFKNFVTRCYEQRYTTMAFALAGLMVGIAIWSGGRVAFVHFPTAETEYLIANVVMNPGAPREQTEAQLRELDRALDKIDANLTDGKRGLVRATFGTVGRSMARNSWQELGSDNMAGLWVELATADERDVRNPEILAAWREEIKIMAGVERIAVQELAGGPGGRPIDIRLWGADYTTLKEAALETRELLSRFPGVMDLDDDLPYGKEELIMTLTPKGKAMGFTTQSVSRQVRNASEGAIAKRFPRENEETKLRVQFPEGTFNAQTFREMYLRGPQGVEVPLTEVVELKANRGFAQIRRFNGRSEVAVTGDVNRDVANLTQLIATLPQEGMDEIASKYGVSYEFAGEAQDQSRSLGEIGRGALLALASIYIILAWVLGSYSRPVVVMSIIPFGLVGAILGHLVLGYDLSMMSLVGLLGLMGILVNDSIILVTTIQERNKLGEPWAQSIVGGTQDRLRAVTLTSLTTIGGLTPLLFETSMQAQFLKPMAITMVFGIGLATLIVLVVLPALLGILEDARGFFGSTRLRLRERLPAPKGGA